MTVNVVRESEAIDHRDSEGCPAPSGVSVDCFEVVLLLDVPSPLGGDGVSAEGPAVRMEVVIRSEESPGVVESSKELLASRAVSRLTCSGRSVDGDEEPSTRDEGATSRESVLSEAVAEGSPGSSRWTEVLLPSSSWLAVGRLEVAAVPLSNVVAAFKKSEETMLVAASVA